MPPKNSIKTYVSDSYYHIYNRGVEKRNIFLEDTDYKAFLSDLKFYLTPIPKDFKGSTLKVVKGEKTYRYYPSQHPKNHADKIQLVGYCLMPNHFHLCIKQTDRDSINHFMRSLSTKYAMYFNKKNKRVGPLFQGIYKAVLITNEGQFIELSKYIHRNPLKILGESQKLVEYPYSSYRNYLGIIRQSWVHPENITCSYSTTNPRNSYQNFVEESTSEFEDAPSITMESDEL